MYTAEFTTDCSILKDALRAAPTMRVEHVDDRMVRDGPIKLLFWANGGEFDAFERGLDEDPTVADVRTLTVEETRRLYRVNYTARGECESFTTLITDLDGTFVDGVVTADQVWMRIRFPDHEAVRAFADWFRKRDRTFTLDALYEETTSAETAASDLTDSQRQALALSHERGYFEIPRGTTGAELDVSQQALSERLRRGISTSLERAGLPAQD
ncbi:GAF and HTH_10 associated domain-containing protein [Halogranum amylolyticum]|uniref:GAF and HTH_10 associated domain-containing protein n=1 Tax=Halogranum amylolyticum TaxID=660520 RepID=A0A1H8SPW7_9EURY|nr:helix-turn-helix domain-containing protein [Halogranum amylolyticum]SEO80742.1 GAF and HTH_10 associated domain-containing protein [Halogranum amylolyticum]